MADENTSNFNFILPEPGGSDFTWGFKLNSTITSIDELIAAIDGKLSDLGAELNTYAKIASPVFTGIPRAPTPPIGDFSKRIATTEYTKKEINESVLLLRGNAPFDMNTFEEIAAALNNDPAFAFNLSIDLSKKANIESPTFTGTPRAPTPLESDTSTRIATTEFISKALNFKANLNSPLFTGIARAPTPPETDNSIRIATTEYVTNAVNKKANIESPVLTGFPRAPTPLGTDESTRIATTEYVSLNLKKKADIESPTFTGTPRAPTPTDTDNSTRVATTAFVNKIVEKAISNAPTAAPTPAPTSAPTTSKVADTKMFAVAYGNGTQITTTDTPPLIAPPVLPSNVDADSVSIPLFRRDFPPFYIKPSSDPFPASLVARNVFGETLSRGFVSYPVASGFGSGFRIEGVGSFWGHVPEDGYTIFALREKTAITNVSRAVNSNAYVTNDKNPNKAIAFTVDTRGALFLESQVSPGFGFADGKVLAVFASHAVPLSNSFFSLGSSAFRWSDCFLINSPNVLSDRNSKENIQDEILGLNFIEKLKPKTYFIKDAENKKLNHGLIAQEVKETIEEMGMSTDDFSGWSTTDANDPESKQSLSYEQFIAPLIKSVQELSEQNKQLTERVKYLETFLIGI